MSINWKSYQKDIIRFLPLLVTYLIIIVVFSPNKLEGDELRHVSYANNIIEGFYAEADNPSLRNGPAYPMTLVLPMLLKSPDMVLRLLNGFYMVLAILFFYKASRQYITPKRALIFSYLLGFYLPMLRHIYGVLSEPFAILCVCCFIFYFTKLHSQSTKQKKHLLLSSIFLGLLAMTKVIFGYVILVGIIGYFFFWILKKTKKAKLGLFIFILSFIFCAPYLIYTYSITGKTFLWGTQGGEMLYWRSSPFPNEVGNWIDAKVVLGQMQSNSYSTTEISKNHKEFVQGLEHLSYVKKDSVYKAKAISNIKQYPTAYIKNTANSISRMFFNYPYSFTPQKLSTTFYIIPNMFLLIAILLSTYLFWKNLKNIPVELIALFLLSLIFIGGLSLLDGRVRHLVPIVPVLIFHIAFSLSRLVDINLKSISKKTKDAQNSDY